MVVKIRTVAPAGKMKMPVTVPKLSAPPTPASVPSSLPNLFEDLYDALLVCEPGGRIARANARAALQFQYPAQDLERMELSSLIGGLTGDVWKTLIGKLKPGHFSILEGRGRTRDGRRFPAEIVIGWFGNDRLLVTVRKAERAPAAAAPSHPLLESLYDGVVITDEAGHVIGDNHRAREVFGYGEEALVGRSILALISGLSAGTVADVLKDLSSGRFTVIEAYGVRKDKFKFPCEIAIGRMAADGAAQLVFSVRNIETRHREQELLRTEHNAVQNSASAIAITDLEARVRMTNSAFLRQAGVASVTDVKGRDVRSFFNEKDRAGEMVVRALGGAVWQGELSHTSPGGRTLHLQVSAAPNRNDREIPIGMVFSFTDITERKRAEQAIRDEAQDQLRLAREQQEFSGRLNILSVPDVLQMIDGSRKSGTLVIQDAAGAEVARVAFLDGQVARAACGDATGEAAVHRLLAVGGHSFQFHQGRPEARDESIVSSTLGLLLEGSRVLDEARAGVPPAASGDGRQDPTA